MNEWESLSSENKIKLAKIASSGFCDQNSFKIFKDSVYNKNTHGVLFGFSVFYSSDKWGPCGLAFKRFVANELDFHEIGAAEINNPVELIREWRNLTKRGE